MHWSTGRCVMSWPQCKAHLAHLGHCAIQGVRQGRVHVLLALHGGQHHLPATNPWRPLEIHQPGGGTAGRRCNRPLQLITPSEGSASLAKGVLGSLTGFTRWHIQYSDLENRLIKLNQVFPA